MFRVAKGKRWPASHGDSGTANFIHHSGWVPHRTGVGAVGECTNLINITSLFDEFFHALNGFERRFAMLYGCHQPQMPGWHHNVMLTWDATHHGNPLGFYCFPAHGRVTIASHFIENDPGDTHITTSCCESTNHRPYRLAHAPRINDEQDGNAQFSGYICSGSGTIGYATVEKPHDAFNHRNVSMLRTIMVKGTDEVVTA